jgi:hypothetical protein
MVGKYSNTKTQTAPSSLFAKTLVVEVKKKRGELLHSPRFMAAPLRRSPLAGR